MIQQIQPANNADQSYQQNQQKKPVQSLQPEKIQHPSLNYSVTEIYMIRKQSIAHSNDLIVKRLSRCFQKIKKFKNTGRQKQLYRQYDQQTSSVRKSWKKVHDLFKMGSKTPEITQKKADKIKARVEKVKKDMNTNQSFLAKDIDISKIYVRAGHNHLQNQVGTEKQLTSSAQKLPK